MSEAIAAQMAYGARQKSGVQLTLAATGIAGPGGGLPNKPVGLVCFAWSMSGAILKTATEQFSGDRDEVRRKTVLFSVEGALKMLRDG